MTKRVRGGKPVAQPKPAVKSKATKEKEASRRRAERLMRPSGCRAYMRKQLAKEFPGIMQGFVKAAKTGSVPHVKLATELLKPTRTGTSRRRKGSLAELLKKLERNKPVEDPEAATRWASPADGIVASGKW